MQDLTPQLCDPTTVYERQTWKTVASQGLARLPAPTEPDDAVLAMLAQRRLASDTGG